MSQILALREKRAKAWEAAKAFLDSKRDGGGLVSAEDTATYDKMEADVVALGKEVERLERQAVLDMEMSTATSVPLAGKPTGGGFPSTDKTGSASDDYKAAFWQNFRSKDPSEAVKNSLKIGTDADGGYLVPDEYERTLVAALEEENIFRTLARVITTSSGDRKIPIVASKGAAAWIDEEGAIPESDDKFAQVSLGAYKVGTMIKVSEELLFDSVFNLEAYIATEFARRIGAKEEEAFFVGDGTGKPTGIFADTGGGQIGVTTAAPAAITLDEVMDLYHSLRTPYRNRAAFVTNDATVKMIRKLKDNTGQYLWQPSVKEGNPDTILNRPIKTSAYVPLATATNKAMAFGDFGFYWVADRQGRIFKKLNELFAVTGQIGFLATQRLDGKLILPEAVKILKMGGTTPP